MNAHRFLFSLSIAALTLAAGCTTAQIEYDRMTGTQYPQEETVAGDPVNLTTIYLQGDRLVGVVEDDDNIAPLTGPFDPSDPNQYDYITDAELDTVVAANRAAPVGSVTFDCSIVPIFSGDCTRYYLYGIVVDHFRERNDGVRKPTTLGRMYDSTLRSGFVGYWKHSTVNSDNAKFLRSTAHEVGHAFNISHCDGDGSTTIMNTTGTVGDTYTYEFSASSLDHLQNHDDDAVWPGISGRDYACPHVH